MCENWDLFAVVWKWHNSSVGCSALLGFVTASAAPKTNPVEEMDVPNYTVPPAGRAMTVCVCVHVTAVSRLLPLLFLRAILASTLFIFHVFFLPHLTQNAIWSIYRLSAKCHNLFHLFISNHLKCNFLELAFSPLTKKLIYITYREAVTEPKLLSFQFKQPVFLQRKSHIALCQKTSICYFNVKKKNHFLLSQCIKSLVYFLTWRLFGGIKPETAKHFSP